MTTTREPKAIDAAEGQRLRDLIANNACTVCGTGFLSVRWHEEQWVAWCGECQTPASLAWDPELLNRYRRGEHLNKQEQATVDRMVDRMARREGMTSTAMTLRDDPEKLKLQLKAKWASDLSNDEAVEQFLMVAQALDLNPWMGEIVPYQGTPYISIKGLVRKARESGAYAGVKTRPATKQEREDAMVAEGDHCWTATVRLRDGSEYQGWGKVTQQEISEQSTYNDNEYNRRKNRVGKSYYAKPVVHAKPAEMAEARAVHDALERSGAIHLPALPEGFIASGLVVQAVNTETGELRELGAPEADGSLDTAPADPFDDTLLSDPPAVSEGQMADLLSACEAASTGEDLQQMANTIASMKDDFTEGQRQRISAAYGAARTRLREPAGAAQGRLA